MEIESSKKTLDNELLKEIKPLKRGGSGVTLEKAILELQDVKNNYWNEQKEFEDAIKPAVIRTHGDGFSLNTTRKNNFI